MHESDPLSPSVLRSFLLALVAMAAGGLLAELVLLEHTESAWQWVPLVLLGVALPLALAGALRPPAAVVRALQLVGVLMLLAGVVGIYLHYDENAAFELESNGALGGWALFREAIYGATPTLAPGSLAQLGLLVLLATFRHPALGRRGGA